MYIEIIGLAVIVFSLGCWLGDEWAKASLRRLIHFSIDIGHDEKIIVAKIKKVIHWET